MTTQTSKTQTLESVYQPVLDALDQLFGRVNADHAVEADFDQATFLLETLPLASDEFGIARLRLTNAKRYRDAKELGAAGWEIRTVMLQLRAKVLAGHRFLYVVRKASGG